MKVGEIWAYRERPYTEGWPVVPVELLQFGPGRASKVRVRYVQGEYHGLDVWVPTVRLRVLWEEVDAWLDDERRFTAAREASLDALDTVEHRAVWSVLYAYPRPDGILLDLDRSEGATVQIEDLDAVAADLGLDTAALRAAPLAFVDRSGTYVAPWPVALRLGRRVAGVYTEQVLRSIAKDEAELQDKAIHGTVDDFRDGASLRVAPERYAERLQSIEAPAFALARQWCGLDAVARFDEAQALREEVVRLRALLRRAITELEEAGRPSIARRLRSQLGVAATDPYSPRIPCR